MGEHIGPGKDIGSACLLYMGELKFKQKKGKKDRKDKGDDTNLLT